MTATPYPADWLRGLLTTCVLKTLEKGPTYGYAIITQLAEAGLGDIKGGTLYPLLNRLENRGLVEVQWREGDGGPGRKYFFLTDAGTQELATLTVTWQTFSTAVTTHLTH